ncbi:Uncharacterised protein [Mycobacteroides abscessus subsp. abscessus]|nr:Uncharacterised protein [Mycobacteroides abscessus subsp. abscessus]
MAQPLCEVALYAVTDIQGRQVGTIARTYVDLNDVEEFHQLALSRIQTRR